MGLEPGTTKDDVKCCLENWNKGDNGIPDLSDVFTDDEVFCTEAAARSGVVFENTREVEDLVVLRYFGPDANPDAPEVGAHRR
jgi:hypothetical protein